MKKLCVANWKMNMGSIDSSQYIQKIINSNCLSNEIKMIICPPFTLIESMIMKLSDIRIDVGAQNMSHNKSGPYTGEISPSMLIDLNCKWVILGHSERRMSYGETSDIVSVKLALSLKSGLNPILCIGETYKQRENGETDDILKSQLDSALSSLSEEKYSLVIAYEPIWAIGTGVNASVEDIKSATNFIDSHINSSYYNIDYKILYGGSVNKNNSKILGQIPKLDGFLVGTASLDANEFFKIYKNLEG